jgi:ceramide glucosyltransferase
LSDIIFSREIINHLLLVAALLSIGYGIYAAYCTWSFFRSEAKRKADPPPVPVSVIKPVAHLEERYRENFASFCRQEYPDFELIFAFPANNDPLVSLLKELRLEFPQTRIDWVIVDPVRGPNHKVGNLIAAVERARHPVLVISDSDMAVGPEYLLRTVTDFSLEKVGLVTSLYRNVGIENLFAALHALTVQTIFIPNVLFSRKIEGLSYAFGATLCTSKEILSVVGGPEVLLDYLADDYQVGNRIYRKGYKIHLSRTLIDQVSHIKGFKECFLQQLRAGITLKVCRPLGYFGSVITHQVALSLLFLLVEWFSPIGLAVFFSACAIRIISGVLLNRTTIRNRELSRYLWMVPLNDLVYTLIWLLSLFTDKVTWKGRRFRALRGGKMVEVTER